MKYSKKILSNKTIIKYGTISFIFIISVIYFSLSTINLNNLMGNSTLNKYYYCEDSTFELKGNVCYKTEKVDPTLIADVTMDEVIDADDVMEIQLYLDNRIKFNSFQKIIADVNNDGIVNVQDIELIQIYLSSKEKYSETLKGTTGADSNLNAYKLGEDKVCKQAYKEEDGICVREVSTYAKEIEFVLGDLNSDSIVDLNDAKILSSYLNGDINLSDIQMKIADINKDNIVDITDLNLINDTFEKEEDSITGSISLTNNIDIKELDINTKLNFKADLKILGDKNYYYKWYNIKNSETLESDCKVVNKNTVVRNYGIYITEDNEYVMLKIYDDENCTKEINSYKSDTLELKKVPNEAYINYALTSLNITDTLVNKNTKLTFNAKFIITGNSNNNLYYRFKAIKDGKVYNPVGCYLIKNGMTRNPTLTINGKDQYGIWEIYNNSMCNDAGLVKKYETKHYNYYADSIKLDKTSARISVGSKLKITPTVKSNINNVNSMIKWTSSNASVATVDTFGNITAKKSGETTIKASIGGYTASVKVTVIDKDSDMNITCPGIEYDTNGNNVTMKILPTPTVKTYDIYYATNNINGTYATWKLQNSNLSGNKSITINKNNTAQVKIVVKSASGTTRNCYSTSYIKQYYTPSSLTKCPSLTYSDSKSGTIRKYKQNGEKVTSGVAKRTVKAKLNKEFQYTWYTQKKDGSYQEWVTYYTSVTNIDPTITGELYNRKGLLMVTDKYGNIGKCYTESVNKLNLSKTTYGNTDIYTESGYPSSDAATVKSIVRNTNKSYLGANKIFLLNQNTYANLLKSSGCGMTVYSLSGDIKIYIRPSGNIPGSSGNCGTSSSSAFFKGSFVHELGHSMDFTYSILNSKNLNMENNLNNYFNNYKNSGFMREYSFSDSFEFWADLFAYKEFNGKVKTDNNLKTLRTNLLNTYNNSYRKNVSKFNEIKEKNR